MPFADAIYSRRFDYEMVQLKTFFEELTKQVFDLSNINTRCSHHSSQLSAAVWCGCKGNVAKENEYATVRRLQTKNAGQKMPNH